MHLEKPVTCPVLNQTQCQAILGKVVQIHLRKQPFKNIGVTQERLLKLLCPAFLLKPRINHIIDILYHFHLIVNGQFRQGFHGHLIEDLALSSRCFLLGSQAQTLSPVNLHLCTVDCPVNKLKPLLKILDVPHPAMYILQFLVCPLVDDL